MKQTDVAIINKTQTASKRIAWKTLLAAAVAVMCLSSCATVSEEQVWVLTQRVNSPRDYQYFIKKYPNSTHVAEAAKLEADAKRNEARYGAGLRFGMRPLLYAKYRSATLASIKPRANPVPVTLAVEWQINGKQRGFVTNMIKKVTQEQIAKLLAETRVLAPAPASSSGPGGTLCITINNISDIGDAIGKGLKPSPMFVVNNDYIDDNYEMTAIYTPAKGAAVRKTYKHAICTPCGLANKIPDGLVPSPSPSAANVVIEDMVLNLLRDLQSEGRL